jgi:hypothetical protein
MMMRTARTWQREARLLLIVAELTGKSRATPWADVVAVDFFMQHPSLLMHLVERSDRDWPAGALASEAEVESSEETLLHWKRSVEIPLLSPMFGRLIARGLLSQASDGTLLLTAEGEKAAKELESLDGVSQGIRLPVLAEAFLADLPASRKWLSDALAERVS